MNEIIMIKWGGSLITDKDKPFTARPEIIQSLTGQIKIILDSNPNLKIILGHGSGSFGHAVANQYQTRSGVNTQKEWIGFARVWEAARKLNNIVMQALLENGIPAVTFPPSACMMSSSGKGIDCFLQPIQSALQSNIVPVVHGDVVFDEVLGGTILSTEDVFLYLADKFKPKKILLAGIEPYIWSDYPDKKIPIKKITTNNFMEIQTKIGHSSSIDVTGGMIEKVRLMLGLVNKLPDTTVSIFSGHSPDCLLREIKGESIGTTIQLE